ncbi:MAG: L-histidine N(alpha)-methyltransferase [Candidatus Andeanibacterium colombiense]|uniref:L-histidine N(Alpha)-methyltransferase n=1 Tax=Candidatus Andeanibacterium colombiense TaxID=3121345 RepID=A0AAJ5X8D2_9SPHN|nr:MAG: L-histidine N(alpha)-methyltransferase [Sphingomonadaceae bacterium]
MAVTPGLRLVTQDEGGIDVAFRADVLAGLGQRQKAIPARWFYDRRGSELFEEITALPEYYPTRTETALLRDHGADFRAEAGPGLVVVEFGSGSSVKTPLLLEAIDAAAYVPIDISGDFLRDSSAELSAKFPDLPIVPVEGDFMHSLELPAFAPGEARLGFFPGSTIGNMVPATAVDLLRSMRATLGDNAQLLIGFDRVKAIPRLVSAYDDAQGVTAQFNLNLLERINRELGADIPLDAFRHRVRWNADWSRIEMHIEALRDVAFTVSGRRFALFEGETIHTENSHKYTPDQARLMLQASGWTPRRCWTDEGEDFMLMLAEATEERSAP